mmetsp:Transcript_8/g.22  ORF Transcript_8/g.22 Transcript_8/m.22 type:complete len:87 (-) Transcript_8:715-975(-)
MKGRPRRRRCSKSGSITDVLPVLHIFDPDMDGAQEPDHRQGRKGPQLEPERQTHDKVSYNSNAGQQNMNSSPTRVRNFQKIKKGRV